MQCLLAPLPKCSVGPKPNPPFVGCCSGGPICRKRTNSLNPSCCQQGSGTGQKEREGRLEKGSVALPKEAALKPKCPFLPERRIVLSEWAWKGGPQPCSAHGKVCARTPCFKQGFLECQRRLAVCCLLQIHVGCCPQKGNFCWEIRREKIVKVLNLNLEFFFLKKGFLGLCIIRCRFVLLLWVCKEMLSKLDSDFWDCFLIQAFFLVIS